MYRHPDPHLDAQATVTPYLRFVQRPLPGIPGRTRNLLQQAYAQPDGTLHWVDVPMVRESTP
jgi:hypothetical protein